MGWRSVLLKPQVIHVDRYPSMNLRPVEPFQHGQMSLLVHRHEGSSSVFKEVGTDQAAVSNCTPDCYLFAAARLLNEGACCCVDVRLGKSSPRH